MLTHPLDLLVFAMLELADPSDSNAVQPIVISRA